MYVHDAVHVYGVAHAAVLCATYDALHVHAAVLLCMCLAWFSLLANRYAYLSLTPYFLVRPCPNGPCHSLHFEHLHGTLGCLTNIAASSKN